MADEYFGTICLCAMRYALGRQTYMPGLVQDFIRSHINQIDRGTIQVMIRDIDDADHITEYLNGEGGTCANGDTVPGMFLFHDENCVMEHVIESFDDYPDEQALADAWNRRILHDCI